MNAHNTNPVIRSQQRLLIVVVSFVMGPLFMLGPAALGIALVIWVGHWATWIFLPVMLAASWWVIRNMLHNFHWVELDGDLVRGRKLWSRRFVEQSLSDLVELRRYGPGTLLPLVGVTRRCSTVSRDIG